MSSQETSRILSHQIYPIGEPMNNEVKELNKLLCENCVERNYENCKSCKVYILVNSLVS